MPFSQPQLPVHGRGRVGRRLLRLVCGERKHPELHRGRGGPDHQRCASPPCDGVH